MSLKNVLIGGKRYQLGKRIGRGGEGEIYLVVGQDDRVVKVYTDGKAQNRFKKIEGMISAGLSKSSELVSFPIETVSDTKGVFIGFTMKLFSGFKDMHLLTGPKSRKKNFPEVDFRFMLRSAANAARAVAQVHETSCVIGDLNESGLLVADDARVALIDADSFQFTVADQSFRCIVGKPDFTPPELQGANLANVLREKAHDQFALAVLLFQIMFMGRHPYSGTVQGPDLTTDQMIAKNLFSYSLKRDAKARAPVGSILLSDFPKDIQDLFERAFGKDSNLRPSAHEWVSSLGALEKRLSKCGAVSSHYYPSHADRCPWCKIEASSGVVFFISAQGSVAPSSKFDLHLILKKLKTFSVPDINSKLPSASVASSGAPSWAARKTKVKWRAKVGFAALVIVVALGALAMAPAAWFVWLFGGFWLASAIADNDAGKKIWREKLEHLTDERARVIRDWRASTGAADLAEQLVILNSQVSEIQIVQNKLAHEIMRLRSHARNRTVSEFLSKFQLSASSVRGVGELRLQALRRGGIVTAADVESRALDRVPNLGPTIKQEIMAWRRKHEAAFSGSVVLTATEVAAQKKVEHAYAELERDLQNGIVAGLAKFESEYSRLQAKISTAPSNFESVDQAYAEVLADLDYLGLPAPAFDDSKMYVQSKLSVRKDREVQWPQVELPVKSPKVTNASAASAARVVGVVTPTHVTPPIRTKPASRTVLTTRKPGKSQPAAIASSPPASQNSAPPTCPKCSSNMVRRTARRGVYAGNQFWGCSRFPSCKGIVN